MGLYDDLKKMEENEGKEEGPSIADEVEKVGAEHAINPPKPSELDDAIEQAAQENQEPPQCACGSHLAGECDECDPKKSDNVGGTCPTCQKTFKHLSRHKCKAVETVTVIEVDTITILKKEYDELKLALDAERKKSAALNTDLNELIDQVRDDGKEKEEKKQEEPKGCALFVDCYPTKLSSSQVHLNFGDLIMPLCKEIAEERNIVNWRLLRYGEGAALLCGKLEKFFQSKEKVPNIIYATSASPEYQACCEILHSHVSAVFEGKG
jgi:hypothetical protein